MEDVQIALFSSQHYDIISSGVILNPIFLFKFICLKTRVRLYKTTYKDAVSNQKISENYPK